MYNKIFLMFMVLLFIAPPTYAEIDNWQPVNYSDPQLIAESGLTIEAFNNLSQKDWQKLLDTKESVIFAFQALEEDRNDITEKINPDLSISVIGSESTKTVKFPETSYENSAPHFINLSDKTVSENETFNYQIKAEDINKDSITYSISNHNELPKKLTINKEGLITWQTDYEDQGDYIIKVEVSDGELANESSFQLTVKNKNAPPVLENSSVQSINENELLEFQIPASDIDNDTLTFSSDNLPEGADLSVDGLFTWKPNYTDSGEYDIDISVNDGIDTDTKSYLVEVIDKNAPPELEDLSIKSTNENELLEFQIPASDIDNDMLTFSSDNLPEGADLSVEGLFAWKPDYTDSGEYDFEVKVYDGDIITKKDYSVQVIDQNAPPVFENIENQTIKENDLFSYQLKANDVDGDKLTYFIKNISDLPEGFSITETGLIEWKSDYSSQGNYNVTVEVSDGVLTDTREFNLNVKWNQIEKTYLYFNGNQDNTATRVTSGLSYINNDYFELEVELYLEESQASFVPVIGSSIGNNINGGIKIKGKSLMFHDYSTHNDDKDIAKTGEILTLNEWQKVKLIYNKGNIKIYRNDVLESAGSFNLNSKGKLIIGAPSSLGSHKYRRFKGYMRNAVVRNSSGVIGEYLFNEGSGTTAKDQTNKNKGNIINPVWQKNYISHDDYNL